MQSQEHTCFPIWFAKIRKAVQKRQTELLKPYGLSSIHAMYLITLLHNDKGMTLRELCESLFVDKANTSRVITTLDALGYIRKDMISKSKLKYKIYLTRQGTEVANIVAKDMKKTHEILFASLTVVEIQTVRNVMNKVQEAVQEI